MVEFRWGLSSRLTEGHLLAVFSCGEGRTNSLLSLVKALIPSQGLHPHNLSYTLSLPNVPTFRYWGFGLQHKIFCVWGTQILLKPTAALIPHRNVSRRREGNWLGSFTFIIWEILSLLRKRSRHLCPDATCLAHSRNSTWKVPMICHRTGPLEGNLSLMRKLLELMTYFKFFFPY